MRKVLYVIPYFYDEADEAWPIKYCNDLPCGFGVYFGGSGIRERPDGTPIDAEIMVEGGEGVHDFLKAQSDVTFIRDLD